MGELMQNEREELISLIKSASNGSAAALGELCERYRPLMESEVRKHTYENMTEQDVADMRQEAMICFCNAVCNYDYTEENVEFGLYAKICIGNALVSYLRYYNRHKDCRVVSIDEASKDPLSHDKGRDPMQALIEEEDLRALKLKIKSSLSPFESRVWWMYVSGMSAAEVAMQLGDIDVRSVTNAIYRIRRKLRRVLSDK